MNPQREVVILGGGLAGLSLALQLRGQHPELGIRILERRTHPVPEAAFKVGESTVEIGAFYFAEVLGLREHLENEQIRKFGFRFFFSEGRTDIDRCTELGVSVQLPTPAWQIDRGRFENFLGERARAMGIEFLDGAVVRSVELDDAGHTVGYEHGGGNHTVHARWVVDASGRAGLLKRKLGLAEDNAHDANAVWLRVDARLDPNDWSDDADWIARCKPPERWRSTIHMCGAGYWLWLIPLASGSHSVGIVADQAIHPLSGMNSFDKAMQWMHAHQPRVAQALAPLRDRLQDFAFLRNFSYGCKQVFSPQRWALTGEAGLFLDPFYSPGSDFIAISNTYIAALIAKDLAGEEFAPYAGIYEQLYFSFYEATLAMYTGQYGLFGDARVLPVKVIWDYTYYWGVLAPLFCSGRIADLPTISRLREELAGAKALNLAMQGFLRAWSEAGDGEETARNLDQSAIDWFADLNRGLADPLDATAFRERLRGNCARLRELAAEIAAVARSAHPELDAGELQGLLDGPPGTRSLDANWYDTAAALAT